MGGEIKATGQSPVFIRSQLREHTGSAISHAKAAREKAGVPTRNYPGVGGFGELTRLEYAQRGIDERIGDLRLAMGHLLQVRKAVEASKGKGLGKIVQFFFKKNMLKKINAELKKLDTQIKKINSDFEAVNKPLRIQMNKIQLLANEQAKLKEELENRKNDVKNEIKDIKAKIKKTKGLTGAWSKGTKATVAKLQEDLAKKEVAYEKLSKEAKKVNEHYIFLLNEKMRWGKIFT